MLDAPKEPPIRPGPPPVLSGSGVLGPGPSCKKLSTAQHRTTCFRIAEIVTKPRAQASAGSIAHVFERTDVIYEFRNTSSLRIL